MKKYEFTDERHPSNPALKRIRALAKLPGVEVGDLGGWIENEDNLAHDGTCWVFDNALVSDNAQVFGNATVYVNAQVYDNAQVYGNAWVYGSARVFGTAKVYGDAQVYGTAQVSGNAWVYDTAVIESRKDYMTFSGLGSEGRFCTLFRTTDGHRLGVGCWSGTIDEFEKRVKAVYDEEHSSSDYLWFIEGFRKVAKRWESKNK